MPVFGCVADDSTGASGAASFLVKGGTSVQLFDEIPAKGSRVGRGIQAIVTALRSRTQDTREVMTDTLWTLGWLEEQRVKRFYLKYCSTSDSTPKGNIGPAADAVMEPLDASYTVLYLALPVSGQVVMKEGLYMDGVPLYESPMKNYPLTLMWDVRITNLTKPQSRYSYVELWKEQMDRPADEIHAILSGQADTQEYYYVIPDYQDMENGERIAELFGGLTLLTGESEAPEPLAKHLSHRQNILPEPDIQAEGAAVLIAGSYSRATLKRIAHSQTRGGFSYKIDPMIMFEDKESLEDAWRFVRESWGTSVFIYSSNTTRNVKEVQQYGQECMAETLEQIAAGLAEQAVAYGIRRVMVAGEETSSAVTKRLEFSFYKIDAGVVPGVPVMTPMGNEALCLVLKFGSFGQEGFFVRVLEMTQTKDGK